MYLCLTQLFVLQKLKEFYVTESRGFLVENPVVKLPKKFAQWEDIGRRLVPLLKANKYRETIDHELPVIGKLVHYYVKVQFEATKISLANAILKL